MLAVIPLRGFDSAKTRLAAEMSATDRARIAAAVAARVVAACRTAGRVMGPVQLMRRVDELIPVVEIPHPAGAARTSAGAESGGAPFESG